MIYVSLDITCSKYEEDMLQGTTLLMNNSQCRRQNSLKSVELLLCSTAKETVDFSAILQDVYIYRLDAINRAVMQGLQPKILYPFSSQPL